MKAGLLRAPGYCEVLGSQGKNNGSIQAGAAADAQAYVDMDFIIGSDHAGMYVPRCYVTQRNNAGATQVRLVIVPEGRRSDYPKVAKTTSAGAGAIQDGQTFLGAQGISVPLTSEINGLTIQGIRVSALNPFFVPSGYFLRAMCESTTQQTSGVVGLAFHFHLLGDCDEVPF